MIAQQHLFDEFVTGYDPSEVLHTDQRLQFHRPIEVGDRLICDVVLDSFRQAAGSDILVTRRSCSTSTRPRCRPCGPPWWPTAGNPGTPPARGDTAGPRRLSATAPLGAPQHGN